MTGAGMGQGGKSARSAPPISHHPLFPAIVALWFGALFGLGSLAIRPSLIEAAVLASHIDAIVAAAAPPLGLTARILLALALAGTGGFIGAAIARRIARPSHEPRQRKRNTFASDDKVALRPISAAGEYGSEAEDRPYAGTRRRGLAIAEDNSPADFHEHAPLPGNSRQILDLADIDFDEAPLDEHPAYSEVEEALSAGLPQADETPLELEPEAFKPAASQPFARSFDEPAPQFAPIAPEAPASEPAMSAGSAVQRIALPTGSAAERIALAPTDTLGHVELIERLALSLQRRREAAAAAVATASTIEVPEASSLEAGMPEAADEAPFAQFEAPVDDEAAAGEEEIASFAQFAGDDAEAPAAETDDLAEEALEDGYSSLLDMSRPIPARQQFVRVEEPEAPADAIEPVVIFPGQSALAAAPFAAPFAAPATETATPAPCAAQTDQSGAALRRFDAPASASIPAQPVSLAASAQQDPEETDRALRAALANLQRMNGAA